MPPTPDEYRAGVLQLLSQQRGSLTSLIEQVDGTLAYDWQRGMGAAASLYGPILDQYAKDLAALRAASDDPAARLTLDWLTSRNAQLASIQQSVAASAEKYGQTAAQTITHAQSAATDMAASDAAQLTQRSLWPAVEGAGVPPSVLFNRPNPDAVAQWVGRAGNGHPLGDLFSGFGAEATQGARQAMMLGLLTGANPKAMASGIANALGISRSRAAIISRTEVLGSYRSAAHETYRANSDVLDGWIWSAGGANPCAMCMGMDGLTFSLSEELVDHPCGKCAPIPVTKSWGDILGPLGIDSSDLEETSMGAEGAYETGPEKFARMSPQQQRAIIGTKTGYEAYQRGEVELKDFIGTRPAEGGFPAMPYQKSLREMEIPTGRAGSPLVEQSPRLRELERAGQLRARDFGAKIEPDQMPAWAQRSRASQAVYQIMRNGLPWNMAGQELPLLSVNIEQMLTEDLSLNVRMAALRLQDMLKQYDTYLERYVRNVTSGASTLGKAPEFVYKPSKELRLLLRAAREDQGVTAAYLDAAAAANRADTAVKDVEEVTAESRGLSQQQLDRLIANKKTFTDPNTGRTAFWTSEVDGEKYFIRPADGAYTRGLGETSLADRVGIGQYYVKVQTVESDGAWYEIQPLLEGRQYAATTDSDLIRGAVSTDKYMTADERMKVNLFSSLISDGDRNVNNMWLTEDGRLLQIDYDAFSPNMFAPSGDLLRLTHYSEDYQTYLALNDAPKPSAEVMSWLRDTLLSPENKQALLDVAGRLSYPATWSEERIAEERTVIVAYQRARLEAFERYAALKGTPNLGELRQFMSSRDILDRAMQEVQASKELERALAAARAGERTALEAGQQAATSATSATSAAESAAERESLAPFGTVDDILARETAQEALYEGVPIGDASTMEKENPEAAALGGERMQKMITTLVTELKDNQAFLKLAREFDYSKDQVDGWMVLWDNAKRAVAAGDHLALEDPEQVALARMTNTEARAWAKERALNDAIYDMLDRYHSLPESVGEDVTVWNADPFQVAVLEAAKKEFGLTSLAHDYYGAEAIAEAKASYGSVQSGIRALLRQMHADTQRYFEEQGITEVQLFRGVRWLEGNQPAEVAWGEGMTVNPLTSQPVASWASNAEVAYNYATGTGKEFVLERGDYGMVLVTRVPVEQIMSMPYTGFGSEPFREIMLLAGDYPVYAVPFTEADAPSIDAIYQLMAGQGPR